MDDQISDPNAREKPPRLGALCELDGTHRDSCGCDGPVEPPSWRAEHERKTRAERNAAWAAKARAELRRNRPAEEDTTP